MAMDPLKEPFLSDQEHNTDHEDINIKTRSRNRSWYWGLALHFSLICFYTAVSLVVISKSQCERPQNAISGLSTAYQPMLFKNLTDNPYAGTPSIEIDNAWDSLLSSMNLRVSQRELDPLDSVGLSNGGKLAWLAVSHNIHCLNLIRQWYYRDHYFPHLEPGSREEAHQASHAEHCIERLRQTSVCNPDLSSLTVFKWAPGTAKPMFDNTERMHTCVDWSKLMESVESRVIPENEWNSLHNPEFDLL